MTKQDALIGTFEFVKDFKDLNHDEWGKAIAGAVFIIGLGVFAYFADKLK